MTLIPAWIDGALEPVEKLEVHRCGLRHKAVSVFVLCGDELLIQRRALGKYHTPGLWANTCCTHPNWNEGSLECAERRLQEELGITGLDLVLHGTTEYRADVGDGLTEHEIVDLFVATVSHRIPVEPNPLEVAEVAWTDHSILRHRVSRNPEKYTPWFRIYLDREVVPGVGKTWWWTWHGKGFGAKRGPLWM